MELKIANLPKNIIESVEKGSIAEELGIQQGDLLVSVNDHEVRDIIDYKYLISDEYIVVRIEKKNGEVWDLEIEKEYDEDLGMDFFNPLIDKAKSCQNKCIFCFIDQLPKNMRKTLYFKDDDSRLSFLQGNFITLTNLNDEDIDRIIKYRLSPINISVHTTNPDLRIKMLNNKNAGNIMDILRKFKKGKLEVNCQIVLVPHVNDGYELKRTIDDLSELYPSVKSVAIVPVGLTKYRENLFPVEPFNTKMAEELIDSIEKIQGKLFQNINTRFVFLSDEFYAMTDRSLPSYEEYEKFPQYENGVGLMRLFSHEIENELKNIRENISLNRNYIIPTGTLAYKFMLSITEKVSSKFDGLNLRVVPIINNFFGHTITVSGLITGQDLIEQLKEYKNIDGIIIPKCMLRKGEEIFLDDITVEDLKDKLKTNVILSDVSGDSFIKIFKKDLR